MIAAATADHTEHSVSIGNLLNYNYMFVIRLHIAFHIIRVDEILCCRRHSR